MLRFFKTLRIAPALLLIGCWTANASLRPGDGETWRLRHSVRATFVSEGGDACSVIDDALASQAIESPAVRDTNPHSTLPGMCAWRSTGVPGDALTVQVDAGGRDKFDFDRTKLPVNDLDGVGDAAFAFVSPAGFVQLGMMKGATYITIILQLRNGEDRLQRAADLAGAIAARL